MTHLFRLSKSPFLTVILLAALGMSAWTKAHAVPRTITPGTVWRDTAGNVIQAHGAGMIRVGETFYWFGEDKMHGSAYQDIPCYASNDLAHWTFRGDALTRQSDGDLGPGRVVERPKVIYNRRTKTGSSALLVKTTKKPTFRGRSKRKVTRRLPSLTDAAAILKR